MIELNKSISREEYLLSIGYICGLLNGMRKDGYTNGLDVIRELVLRPGVYTDHPAVNEAALRIIAGYQELGETIRARLRGFSLGAMASGVESGKAAEPTRDQAQGLRRLAEEEERGGAGENTPGDRGEETERGGD